MDGNGLSHITKTTPLTSGTCLIWLGYNGAIYKLQVQIGRASFYMAHLKSVFSSSSLHSHSLVDHHHIIIISLLSLSYHYHILSYHYHFIIISISIFYLSMHTLLHTVAVMNLPLNGHLHWTISCTSFCAFRHPRFAHNHHDPTTITKYQEISRNVQMCVMLWGNYHSSK